MFPVNSKSPLQNHVPGQRYHRQSVNHSIVFGLNSYYLIIIYFIVCIAIPFWIELKIDINDQRMLQLKKQIIGLFKSFMEGKNYSQSIDLQYTTQIVI